MLVYPLSKTNFVRRCTVAFITNGIARKGPWHFMCFLWAAVAFMGLFISPSVLFVAFMVGMPIAMYWNWFTSTPVAEA